jgi:hypothetical protein
MEDAGVRLTPEESKALHDKAVKFISVHKLVYFHFYEAIDHLHFKHDKVQQRILQCTFWRAKEGASRPCLEETL